jgi:Phasin protein
MRRVLLPDLTHINDRSVEVMMMRLDGQQRGRTMTTNLMPASFIDRMSETAALNRENFTRMTRGYERVMKGLMNVAVQQIEMTQGLMAGGMADLDLLTEARSPVAFVQAELEIFRRRSERAASAARQIADELNRTFAETYAFAASDGMAEAKPAPVAEIVPNAVIATEPVAIPDAKPVVAAEVTPSATADAEPVVSPMKITKPAKQPA